MKSQIEQAYKEAAIYAAAASQLASDLLTLMIEAIGTPEYAGLKAAHDRAELIARDREATRARIYRQSIYGGR